MWAAYLSVGATVVSLVVGLVTMRISRLVQIATSQEGVSKRVEAVEHEVSEIKVSVKELQNESVLRGKEISSMQADIGWIRDTLTEIKQAVQALVKRH